ncbi:acetolactate synthase small subunit [Desulfothermobacter acidiphilus]|uniref:acetolactate synthase small subunit n=1 Tax=Desulfothermobacter acidiphilus TaxID=1938353 RepID=UPI003F887BD6
MRHTLSVLVENHPGVLARVANLFRRRGYNIESLAVGSTEDPSFSRMTIVVEGDDQVIDQVTRQLDKLIEVVQVEDLTREEHVNRELALIKVQADPSRRGEVIQMVDIFRAHVVDVSPETLIVEVTGDEGKVAAMIEALRPFGIKEMVRTGKLALLRGPRALNAQ